MTGVATPLPGELGAAGPARADALDAAYRAITWRLIPFLFVLWVLAWIDRVNVGFVKLTMLDELKWSETVYGFGAGISSSAISSSRCRATCCCSASAPARPSPASRSAGARSASR